MRRLNLSPRILTAFLIIAGLLVWFPSLSNNFVWDDEEQVVLNTAVHSIQNIPLLFQSSTFNGGGGSLTGMYYKPLMSSAFAVVYTFFGPSPWAFHLFQILFHIGSTLLLFALFNLLIKNKNIAFIASLIFLIHPLNAETVVYISCYQDVMYFFFGMSALLWLVISKDSIGLWDYLLCGFLLLLSLLSKETGLLFAAVIFLYLWLFTRKKYAFSWAVAAVFSLASYLALRLGLAQIYFQRSEFTPIANLSLPERLQNTPSIILHYLSLFIFPKNLIIDQQWIVSSPQIFQTIIVFLIFSFLVWLEFRIKNKTYTFFLLWFVIGLLAHIQLVPLDLTVSDRWFYFPMAGLLGLLATLLSQMKLTSKHYIAFAVIILALLVRTFVRIGNWKSGLTLYGHDITYNQNSFDLQNNLGVELYRAGRNEEALTHFARSTELAPDWWTNWNNLGAMTEQRGDLQTAQEYYKKAIDNGHYYLAYQNYAKILVKQKKYKEAKIFITESLNYFPYNETLRILLSELRQK